MTSLPTFAELNLPQPEPSGDIIVRMNGTEIEIKNETSPELVESVLSVLKQLC